MVIHRTAPINFFVSYPLINSNVETNAIIITSPATQYARCRDIESKKDATFIFKVRLHRGDIARKLEIYNLAQNDLKEAASLDPQSAVTWNLLGLTNFATKNYAESEKCFSNAIEVLEEVPSYYYMRGLSRLMVHRDKGKDEVVELVGNYLSDAIDDLKTAVMLQRGIEEDLIEESNEIIKGLPDLQERLDALRLTRASFHNGLSMAFLDRGNDVFNKKAMDNVDIALEIDPNNHEFLHQSGLCHLALSETSTAMNNFTKALSFKPDFCPSIYNIAKIFHSSGDLLRAQDNLDDCIRLGNEGVEASDTYRERGIVRFENRELPESEVDFTMSLDVAKTNEVDTYFYRGESRRCQGNYVGALEDFAVVEMEGEGTSVIESGRYRFSRGMCLAHLGKPEEGLKDLTLACETDPTNTQYISYRADVLAQLGMFSEAEEVLSTAVGIHKRRHAHGLWPLLRKLSVALYKQGKYSEAAKNFHQALLHSKQATNHLEVADLLYKRGVCLAHLKKHSRAWSCFDKALSYPEVKMRPERILYYHERAKSGQMCGKHADAVTDFTQVVKLNPLDHRAIFRRGWSFKALGMFLAAADDFERAKEIKPEERVYKLNYRAIGNLECIILGKAGEEAIPESLQDEFLESVNK